MEVEAPSEGMFEGLSDTVTVEVGPVSVRVAVPDFAPEVAVIVSWSAVTEALTVIGQVPSVGPDEAVVQVAPDGKVTSPLVVKATAAVATRLPLASFTVAVAVEVAAPSAGMFEGFSDTVTLDVGPVSVRVAAPERDPTLAVIVSWSAVIEALTPTVHVPDAVVVQVAPAGKVVSPLVVKATRALATDAAAASFTLAVAVEVEAPSAGREDGLRATVTVPGVNSVRVAVPERNPTVAVIVSWSAVIDALTVTEHVPDAVVVQVAPEGKVTSPLVLKNTAAAPMGLALASFTLAVAVEVEAPSAGREDGLRATVTVPGVNSVRVAAPERDPTVAVIVSWSAVVVDALTVTEHVPTVGPEAVIQVVPAGKVVSPLVVKVTSVLATRRFRRPSPWPWPWRSRRRRPAERTV